MSAEHAVPPEGHAYSFRPSLIGAPHEFRLTERGVEWTAGRSSGSVTWRDVSRVRMSFRPTSMQSYRFVTEIRSADAPKLVLVSTSWKGMAVQERLDNAYTAFVTEFHRRLAQAQTPARFEQGASPLQYWPGVAVVAGLTLALVLLIARTLQAGVVSAAIFTAAFLALFLWRAIDYFRRNRPGLYDPAALPAELLPKS